MTGTCHREPAGGDFPPPPLCRPGGRAWPGGFFLLTGKIRENLPGSFAPFLSSVCCGPSGPASLTSDCPMLTERPPASAFS
ncbi:MAG: hypothetical protein C6P37_01900 [Caldibacillus debilis]|uniref:Uncharacterized protein n=1 Tax=Caldibacillus debilis TaxID=301148 RepID=A0A3E0K7Q9_9BACI|nr:MAG: hypothetical protein C6P37_01900 [Caldibacillus debilis]